MNVSQLLCCRKRCWLCHVWADQSEQGADWQRDPGESGRCLSQSCITLTNCSTLPCRWNLSCFMTGTHQGFSAESRALQVYGEESEDPAHPWTIIRCGWTSSFTQDYSLNTIFCGPTDTQNPLFVVAPAAQSVIKDLCCGSHKHTRKHTRGCINLACVHVVNGCCSLSVFMHVFCKTEMGGRQQANSWPGLHTLREKASWPHLSRKQLELSPLRYTTFQHAARGRGEQMSQVKWVRLNLCQRHFFAQKKKKNIWCGAFQGNKKTQKFSYTQRENKG